MHVPGLENYLSSGIINHNSGKSHFFAELLIEEHVANPDQQSVCIREIQKSLKFSAKKLLESKIRALGVSHIFEVTLTEIRNKRGIGIIIFQGMQDHTADSVKSLEGFDRAWVEEAQNLSARSMQLLRPTIRKEGSQIWFGWNPDQPTDPVDELMCGPGGLPPNSVLVNVNYCDNPFLPDTLRQEMEFDRARNPDSFGWIWLGEYNKRSDSQVFAGKWRVDEFEPGSDWDGPYHGLDFGFANDPTAATKCWIHDQRLWIEREAGRTGLELDDTASYLESHIPGIAKYVVRADSARPESISYLRRPDPDGKRKHMPLIESVKKWPGSIEDGVTFIRSFKEIVIHTRCAEMQKEARLYSYKIDKRTGDIMPDVADAHNNYWDSVRYALADQIRQKNDMAVFGNQFSAAEHIARTGLWPLPKREIFIGWHLGLEPACVFAQVMDGRVRVLEEVIAAGLGARAFANDVVAKLIRTKYTKNTFVSVGDRRLVSLTLTDERSCAEILDEVLGPYGIITEPAYVDDMTGRLEAVRYFLEGKTDKKEPLITIDPSCKTLIKGFDGGYFYKVTGEEKKMSSSPEDNEYSIPHNALQFLLAEILHTVQGKQ